MRFIFISSVKMIFLSLIWLCLEGQFEIQNISEVIKIKYLTDIN